MWHFCDARYLFLIFEVQDLPVDKLHQTALIALVCSLEETPMFKSLHSFAKDESGATAIEYGLIAALIAVAAIGALTSVGSSLDTLFTSVSSKLNSAVS